RKDHGIALLDIGFKIKIAETAGVEALDPGQSARGQIRRGARPRQIFQNREARLRTFEGDCEFPALGPTPDRKHLASDLPDARVAPLDDMRGVRQAGAKRVVAFPSHEGAKRCGKNRFMQRHYRPRSLSPRKEWKANCPAG